MKPARTPAKPGEAMALLKVEVEDGKYTLVCEANGELYALRHGERWRELIGDKFVLCLGLRIDALEKERKDVIGELSADLEVDVRTGTLTLDEAVASLTCETLAANAQRDEARAEVERRIEQNATQCKLYEDAIREWMAHSERLRAALERIGAMWTNVQTTPQGPWCARKLVEAIEIARAARAADAGQMDAGEETGR